jgi:hypothetical protein
MEITRARMLILACGEELDADDENKHDPSSSPHGAS